MKKKRLIWRLYPSYLVITLISLMAISWYASVSLRQFFLNKTETDLYAQCLLLEKQIIRYLADQKTGDVDRLCKETGGNAPTRITVILSNGTVIGDSEEDPLKMDNHRDRPEILNAFAGKPGASIRFSNTLKQKMMYMAIPVYDGDSLRGVLRASIPITAIDSEVRKIQIKIMWGGCLIAILAAIVCFIVSWRISRPVEKLIQGADMFSKGDLSHRLSPPETLEFSVLAESMNRMAAELEERISNIETQRNEYEAVLSSMKEGVIAVDRDERILSINKAAADMIESTLSKVKGVSIQEAVRNRKLHGLITDSLAAGRQMERDISIRKDAERIIYIRSTPLFGQGENLIGILMVLSDVTQLRRLENMRRDFVANVSHELKTPLTAIKGFVETLQQGALDSPDDAKRFLGIIEKHVNRLNHLIDDLMELSKIEKMDEKDEIVIKRTGVRNVIDTAVSLCEETAAEKHITIEVACSDDITANVDAYLIEQAFLNLLDNAIKYSASETSVQINVSVSDKEIIISFKDSGMGIAEEHLPRLFERFYRVDKARSRKMGGTGLGLAIVKHIIQAHGGRITVESVQGKGSTFHVHLPNA